MINSLKIELNRTIITNEDHIYYSNMIPHLLVNSKSDDLLFRGIDLHDNVTFNTNTNKKIFITNANDTVAVKIPIYLKDISDCFRQLNFPLEFCEYNISIQIVDEIHYKAANMNIESQNIKSAYLYTDVCYLDEKNNIDYIRNINNFNKTIPIFGIAGWCSGFTLASCAEGWGFDPSSMQVVQLPNCELLQLRLEIYTP